MKSANSALNCGRELITLPQLGVIIGLRPCEWRIILCIHKIPFALISRILPAYRIALTSMQVRPLHVTPQPSLIMYVFIIWGCSVVILSKLFMYSVIIIIMLSLVLRHFFSTVWLWRKWSERGREQWARLGGPAQFDWQTRYPINRVRSPWFAVAGAARGRCNAAKKANNWVNSVSGVEVTAVWEKGSKMTHS